MENTHNHNHGHEDHNHEEHEHHGHGAHSSTGHGHHHANFKKKFWISLILGIPIMLMVPMMGIEHPFMITFSGSQWIVFILSTILFFYGGQPFLSGAKNELQEKSPGMMTLISLGITVSYLYSAYGFLMNEILQMNLDIMDFSFELAALIIVMLLGHWIEMRAVQSAGNALEKIAELLPDTANVVDENGDTKEIPLEEVQEGNYILVKAGDNIPADGEIVSGNTSVNESMVTGESKDMEKKNGDTVIGGSINGSGSITVEVTGTGDSGYISQVINMVGEAQSDKSRAENISDKVAKWLFYIAVTIGIAAFIIWMFITGDINTSLQRLVTVLIIACPHALGLAIPLVVARTTSIGAKNGLLLQDRHALEEAEEVDVVMMDKTGTLTEGNFAVNEFISFKEDTSDEEMLSLMAALEKESNHPLATGILNKIEELDIHIPKAKNIDTISGVGLEGTVDGKNIKITNASYLDENNISYDKNQFEEISGARNTVSFLVIDEEAIGLVAQGDQIKEESKELVESLKAQNIQPVMLTGDNDQVAQAVANEIGIDTVHAQLLPEDKEKLIKEYQNDGKKVMMVGDGVNDAVSLTRADVGIAIGAGTDVAIDSAEVVLVKSNPLDILNFLKLSDASTSKMTQNLWWGAGYNIIALPLAAGVLAPIGILLPPALGAALMSLSTIIVAINAMLLNIDTEK